MLHVLCNLIGPADVIYKIAIKKSCNLDKNMKKSGKLTALREYQNWNCTRGKGVD